jgi:hypothetical protein
MKRHKTRTLKHQASRFEARCFGKDIEGDSNIMADSMKGIKNELDKFIAAISELAPAKKFGNISLDDLKSDKVTMNTKDETVDLREASLKASRTDRKDFYMDEKTRLEMVKNGVLGDADFGPDSPLIAAMGFKRKSERASGLTHKEKEEKPA